MASSKRDSGRKKRATKALSSESELSEAALSYLNRYDASGTRLKQVLLRKIRASGEESTLGPDDVDRLIERLKESRLIDDQRFAASLTSSLRRRGASSLKIASKLRTRGIGAPEAEQARSEDPVSELEAARTYAQKRRLRTRFDLTDPKERQKALAALARQGFSFETASRALVADEDE